MAKAIRAARPTLLTILANLVLVVAAHASDALEVIGPVYPIVEPDLLATIEARLRDAQGNGEIERWRADWERKVRAAVRTPTPAAALGVATKARSYYYDPTLEVPYDVTDAEGRIVQVKGSRLNPLDTVALSQRLLFFDARDPKQVAFAATTIERYDGRVKLILTAGSYLDLMRDWHRRVWYDQRAALVHQLGIQHLPALVSQEGRRLRVDELPPPKAGP